MTALLPLALFFLACSIAYNLLVLEAARRYRGQERGMRNEERELPPVSIFKPLRGADPHLYECLASFCRQDYPAYEILCCVADPNDPAVAVVERLQKEFPHVTIRMLSVDRTYGTNQKINSLDKMHREMRYDYLLVSDDDVRVGPDYLRHVMAELTDPQVGVLTCPYRGQPGGTAASTMEGLGVAGEFFAGVLMARMLQGIKFALGSTMACRKERLEEIGGFPAFADYLADDYELGARITARGHAGKLSSYVVDTLLPADNWAAMISHQFRWMVTQTACRPLDSLGLIFTYGAVFALLAIALAPEAPLVWAMTGCWLAARMLSGSVVGAVLLNDPTVRRYFWLLPIRELLSAVLWAGSLFIRTVSWKGERYRLEGGKMVRI